MIIITVKSGYQFKYKGSIVLHANDFGWVVSANSNWMESDWAAQTTDLFPYDDIESIVGEYDRIRVGNDGLIAEQYFAPGLTLRKQEKWTDETS